MNKLKVLLIILGISISLNSFADDCVDIKKENKILKGLTEDAANIIVQQEDKISELLVDLTKEKGKKNSKEYIIKIPFTPIGLTIDETRGVAAGMLATATNQPFWLLIVFLDFQ